MKVLFGNDIVLVIGHPTMILWQGMMLSVVMLAYGGVTTCESPATAGWPSLAP